MPFAFNYLVRNSTSGNVDGGKAWIYNGTSTGSNESISTITSSGYFNPAQTTLSYSFATGQTGTTGPFAVSDVIQINANDTNGVYIVTSVTTNVTLVAQSEPGDITGATSLGGTFPIYAGVTGSTLEFNGIILGTNLTGSISGGALLINTSGPADFVWNDVTSSTQLLVPNQGFATDNGASLVNYTLPTVAPFGTIITILGYSSGGWKINQNGSPSQQIIFGTSSTTAGATGYLSSTNASDNVQLFCMVANTIFIAFPSSGAITVH